MGGVRHEFQNQDHRPTYERDHLHSCLSGSGCRSGCRSFLHVRSRKNTSHTASEKSRYKPGVYTSSITLNENTFDVEVTVNADRIKAIRLVNLNEATKASYPLMEPVLDSLASQIYSSQSLEDIQYAGDRKYTSQVLLSAITDAVKKRRTLKLSALRSTFRFQSSPAHPARSLHLHHLAF